MIQTFRVAARDGSTKARESPAFDADRFVQKRMGFVKNDTIDTNLAIQPDNTGLTAGLAEMDRARSGYVLVAFGRWLFPARREMDPFISLRVSIR